MEHNDGTRGVLMLAPGLDNLYGALVPYQFWVFTTTEQEINAPDSFELSENRCRLLAERVYVTASFDEVRSIAYYADCSFIILNNEVDDWEEMAQLLMEAWNHFHLSEKHGYVLKLGQRLEEHVLDNDILAVYQQADFLGVYEGFIN